ncbi:unnamed protein product [Medioppia subpectinata]|uniref:DUF7789 domain-containing protein n=1 Tax=Medioppia subpectinata TaxID=1979941 RepID=A0A7R9KST4_9ACAR|nr:unnamed protein product [Medioppia subpectinata]CAG2109195.1 unnamed protein product [Medioppia subpectinata]
MNVMNECNHWGVFRERAFELIAFVATITIVLVYVIFNYSANQSHSSIKIARLTITCLFAPILIVGGIVFTMRYLRSKNLIFRTVGANAEMQRICEILFAAQSLLKFDVQLAGSSLILWLRKGFRHWDQTDQIVVSIGSIVTIAWISLGLLAMRFENKPTVYYSEGVDDEVLELSVYTSGLKHKDMELNTDDNKTGQNMATDGRQYTLADLGLRAEPLVRQTPIGPTRSLYSLSAFEWIYLLISLTTVVSVAGICVDRLIALPKSSQDFTFALLLLWTTGFSLVYVIQGVVRERVLELLAFVATICILMLYVIINYCASQSPSTLKIVRLTITCVFGPILILTGLIYVRKYWQSKSLIYRTVGANIKMQNMCETLFIAQSLLIFDVQLSASSLILWLRNGIEYWTSTEIIVMRFENKPMVYYLWTNFCDLEFCSSNYIRGVGDEMLENSMFMSGGLKQKVYGSGDQITCSEANQPIRS